MVDSTIQRHRPLSLFYSLPSLTMGSTQSNAEQQQEVSELVRNQHKLSRAEGTSNILNCTHVHTKLPEER
jgi:hypothetical protein